MFVTFEGCEGVGKTTQLNLLKEYLESTGQPAVFVREPGSTEISEQIRKIILDPSNTAMTDMTEAYLYAASRAQLVREVIKPALERGELVICDRYVDSSIAYQGYGRQMGAHVIKNINSYALEACMPDLTIFIDLRPSEAWRTTRMNDRIEQETAEFHERVYEGYANMTVFSNGRIVPIQPCNDKKATAKRIIKVMRTRGIIK